MVLSGGKVAPGTPYVAIRVRRSIIEERSYLTHWALRNLEQRKEVREQAWQVDGWAETVSKV